MRSAPTGSASCGVPADRVALTKLSNGRNGSGGSLFLARLALAHLPQTNGLGQLGATAGVIRSHHRVVARQTPFLPILVRGHVKLPQVPFEGLELLPVLQAHDVVGLNGLLDRNRRDKWHFRLLLRALTAAIKDGSSDVGTGCL